jgi:hypothetical protein
MKAGMNPAVLEKLASELTEKNGLRNTLFFRVFCVFRG